MNIQGIIKFIKDNLSYKLFTTYVELYDGFMLEVDSSDCEKTAPIKSYTYQFYDTKRNKLTFGTGYKRYNEYRIKCLSFLPYFNKYITEIKIKFDEPYGENNYIINTLSCKYYDNVIDVMKDFEKRN